MRMTRKVRDILSNYESDCPGTKANLARILMTGKPPRIREILRWLRAPVGTPLQRPTDDKDASVTVGPEPTDWSQ